MTEVVKLQDGTPPSVDSAALARYAKPLLVTLGEMGVDGTTPTGLSLSVLMEGDEFFRSSDDEVLSTSFSEVVNLAQDTIAATLGRKTGRFFVEDIEYPGLPQIGWRIEGLWSRGSKGNWGDVVNASSSEMAALGGHMGMLRDDNDHEAFVSTKEEIRRLVASIGSNTIFEPIPLVMPDREANQLLKRVSPHLADLPKDVQEGLAPTLNILSGAPIGERMPKGASAGDICIVFTSSMPSFEGIEMTAVKTAKEFEDEVGDPKENSDQLDEFILAAAKGVASRFFDYDAIGNDSQYLELVDNFVGKLTIVDFGVAGPLRNFQIDAVWNDDDDQGPWSDDVTAVDTEDAEFQAALAMANADAALSEGREGFEEFSSSLSCHRIDVLPLELSTDDQVKAIHLLAAADTDALPEPVREIADTFRNAIANFEVVMGLSKAEEILAPVKPSFAPA